MTVQGLIKKIITGGILCLPGMLILYLDAAPVVLATWLILTVATVLLLSVKDGPQVYIQRRPSHGTVR